MKPISITLCFEDRGTALIEDDRGGSGAILFKVSFQDCDEDQTKEFFEIIRKAADLMK